MLNKVVEEGTGKRAALEGIRPPARPARPTATAMPGSSATPATSSPASGTATTITAHEQHDRRHASGHDLEGGDEPSPTRTSRSARSRARARPMPAASPRRDVRLRIRLRRPPRPISPARSPAGPMRCWAASAPCSSRSTAPVTDGQGAGDAAAARPRPTYAARSRCLNRMQTEALLTNAPAAAPMRAPHDHAIDRFRPPRPDRHSRRSMRFCSRWRSAWARPTGPSTATRPSASLRLGPWQAWPKLGSPEADPYMRAILAHRGDVPLATGEGLGFTAGTGQRRQAARFRLLLPHRHGRTRRPPLDRSPSTTGTAACLPRSSDAGASPRPKCSGTRRTASP